LEWVGSRSLERGRQYSQDGAVFAPQRQGPVLKARCQGSAAEAYDVQVTLGAQGIVAADCSCQVGEGGRCKHVAALLLVWQANSGEFVEMEELDASLERRSKAELIALVKQMLRQQPDLESLLATPLPAQGKRFDQVDSRIYRHQAAAAFRLGGEGWGATARIARELLAITAIGDGFLEQQDQASGSAVYEAVLAEVLEQFELFRDEEGSLHQVIHACVDGLGSCLSREQDPPRREAILRALFAVYRSDVEAGGIGFGDDAAELLLEHTNPAERGMIADWVRDALPQGSDRSDGWERQAFGGFLLELEADSLDDEAFLRVCRETGRIHDLVDRFLDLGRVEEAVTEARKAGDYDSLGLADLFVGHGHGDVAECLMLERAEKTTDTRVLEWLENYYRSHGRDSAALAFAERVFRLRPSLDKYKELRELAKRLGGWDTLRPDLLAFLGETRNPVLLVRIHLEEGQIDSALEVLESWQQRNYFIGGEVRIEVARAAEESRPRAALEIYRRFAEILIKQQGRGNYATACELLSRVRDLHRRLGEEADWRNYVGDLRERNRSLRALKEELAAAGL
jgi:uncharacterized Zn finger protein